MGAPLSVVFSSFGKAIDFVSKDFNTLFIEFLKAYILPLIPLLVAGGIVLATYILAGSTLALVIAIPLIIVALLINMAFAGVPYRIFHERTLGNRINIIEEAKRTGKSVIGYNIAMIIILIIVLLPMIIASVAASTIGWVFALLIIILDYIALLVVIILIQFGLYELVLNKRGVFDSIKTSVSLVKKNLVAVFVFDVVLGVVALMFYAIVAVIQMLNFIAGIVLSLFVEPTIMGLICIPPGYYLWKALISETPKQAGVQQPKAGKQKK